MSTRTVHKLYWDFEKEERWLNEMAARGLNLVRYRWGTYTLEQGTPGEWTYRIELLPEVARHPDSVKYLDFMADAGVETIATYLRWVYFRKRAAEGPFELYSDTDSRIAHYTRVMTMYGALTAALTASTASGLHSVTSNGLNFFSAPLFAVQIAILVAFATYTLRVALRVRSLKTQKQLFE
ncbi:MAG TPA: DUF2812 domain-containing protein [Coriobacteriia bacterium]